MSFGFSISDLLVLTQLTKQTYNNWKSACGEYTEITGELRNLDIILHRIETQVGVPGSLLFQHIGDGEDLNDILSNCNMVVTQLRDVLKKHKSLSTLRSRNWDRLRLASNNLGD
jgi:hypothetical protein